VSTQINITVDSGGLSARAKQQQEAARLAQLERERTRRVEAEAKSQRDAKQAAEGRRPDGQPQFGAPSPKPRQQDEPAATRRTERKWKSLLKQPPFLIYNEPLIVPANFIGPGPVALGYFTAEGRRYQYLHRGTGLSSVGTPGQSILSYESGTVGPYLLSTYSGRGDAKSNVAETRFRRVFEYDTTDLQTLASTVAVLNPPVPIRRHSFFNTCILHAWFGFTTGQSPDGINSTWSYRANVSVLGEQPVHDFGIQVIHDGRANTVNTTMNCSIFGGFPSSQLTPTFNLPYTFATTLNTLTWINLKFELSNNGSIFSIYAKKSVEDSYELVGFRELNNPVPIARRSLDQVVLRSTSQYFGAFPPPQPPPVAVGSMYASYA
jgi:hypothetical protein